jgi:hypothetical protein
MAGHAAGISTQGSHGPVYAATGHESGVGFSAEVDGERAGQDSDGSCDGRGWPVQHRCCQNDIEEGVDLSCVASGSLLGREWLGRRCSAHSDDSASSDGSGEWAGSFSHREVDSNLGACDVETSPVESVMDLQPDAELGEMHSVGQHEHGAGDAVSPVSGHSVLELGGSFVSVGVGSDTSFATGISGSDSCVSVRSGWSAESAVSTRAWSPAHVPSLHWAQAPHSPGSSVHEVLLGECPRPRASACGAQWSLHSHHASSSGTQAAADTGIGGIEVTACSTTERERTQVTDGDSSSPDTFQAMQLDCPPGLVTFPRMLQDTAANVPPINLCHFSADFPRCPTAHNPFASPLPSPHPDQPAQTVDGHTSVSVSQDLIRLDAFGGKLVASRSHLRALGAFQKSLAAESKPKLGAAAKAGVSFRALHGSFACPVCSSIPEKPLSFVLEQGAYLPSLPLGVPSSSPPPLAATQLGTPASAIAPLSPRLATFSAPATPSTTVHCITASDGVLVPECRFGWLAASRRSPSSVPPLVTPPARPPLRCGCRTDAHLRGGDGSKAEVARALQWRTVQLTQRDASPHDGSAAQAASLSGHSAASLNLPFLSTQRTCSLPDEENASRSTPHFRECYSPCMVPSLSSPLHSAPQSPTRAEHSEGMMVSSMSAQFSDSSCSREASKIPGQHEELLRLRGPSSGAQALSKSTAALPHRALLPVVAVLQACRGEPVRVAPQQEELPEEEAAPLSGPPQAGRYAPAGCERDAQPGCTVVPGKELLVDSTMLEECATSATQRASEAARPATTGVAQSVTHVAVGCNGASPLATRNDSPAVTRLIVSSAQQFVDSHRSDLISQLASAVTARTAAQASVGADLRNGAFGLHAVSLHRAVAAATTVCLPVATARGSWALSKDDGAAIGKVVEEVVGAIVAEVAHVAPATTAAPFLFSTSCRSALVSIDAGSMLASDHECGTAGSKYTAASTASVRAWVRELASSQPPAGMHLAGPLFDWHCAHARSYHLETCKSDLKTHCHVVQSSASRRWQRVLLPPASPILPRPPIATPTLPPWTPPSQPLPCQRASSLATLTRSSGSSPSALSTPSHSTSISQKHALHCQTLMALHFRVPLPRPSSYSHVTAHPEPLPSPIDRMLPISDLCRKRLHPRPPSRWTLQTAQSLGLVESAPSC